MRRKGRRKKENNRDLREKEKGQDRLWKELLEKLVREQLLKLAKELRGLLLRKLMQKLESVLKGPQFRGHKLKPVKGLLQRQRKGPKRLLQRQRKEKCGKELQLQELNLKQELKLNVLQRQRKEKCGKELQLQELNLKQELKLNVLL